MKSAVFILFFAGSIFANDVTKRCMQKIQSHRSVKTGPSVSLGKLCEQGKDKSALAARKKALKDAYEKSKTCMFYIPGAFAELKWASGYLKNYNKVGKELLGDRFILPSSFAVFKEMRTGMEINAAGSKMVDSISERFRQLKSDGKCEKFVIKSHSRGSAIAEALKRENPELKGSLKVADFAKKENFDKEFQPTYYSQMGIVSLGSPVANLIVSNKRIADGNGSDSDRRRLDSWNKCISKDVLGNNNWLTKKLGKTAEKATPKILELVAKAMPGIGGMGDAKMRSLYKGKAVSGALRRSNYQTGTFGLKDVDKACKDKKYPNVMAILATCLPKTKPNHGEPIDPMAACSGQVAKGGRHDSHVDGMGHVSMTSAGKIANITDKWRKTPKATAARCLFDEDPKPCQDGWSLYSFERVAQIVVPSFGKTNSGEKAPGER